MRRLITLLRRELAAFYQAPIAYVILFFFLILNGLSFWFALILLSRGPSELTVTQGFFNSVFFWMAYLLVFPVITMRLFAEEFKLGTIETLMTAPVRDWEVVGAKFLAAFIFYVSLWLPSWPTSESSAYLVAEKRLAQARNSGVRICSCY